MEKWSLPCFNHYLNPAAVRPIVTAVFRLPPPTSSQVYGASAVPTPLVATETNGPTWP